VPVVAQMAAIFALSEIEHPPGPPFPAADKAVHVVLYAVLAALLVRALARGRLAGVTRAVLLGAIAISIAYGVTDEIHQAYVGRVPDALDLAADAAGAALAAAAIHAWDILTRRGL
jgi:VanZ family protein